MEFWDLQVKDRRERSSSVEFIFLFDKGSGNGIVKPTGDWVDFTSKRVNSILSLFTQWKSSICLSNSSWVESLFWKKEQTDLVKEKTYSIYLVKERKRGQENSTFFFFYSSRINQ